MIESQVIRCECSNIICVRMGNKVTVKRHGRTAEVNLYPNQKLRIICEKCNKDTYLKGENKSK